MKKLLLLAVALLTGCTSAGLPAPDVAARVAQDSACVLSLAATGAAISSGMGAGAAIAVIAQAGQQNPAVLSACAAMLSNLAQDVEGAKAKAAK